MIRFPFADAAKSLTLAILGLALCAAAPAKPPAAPGGASEQPKPPAGITLPVKVVGVVDGDTLEVAVDWRIRVRLLDCWAPELKKGTEAEKKAGFKAKLDLAALAVGKPATLFVPTDKASRVGDVFTFDRILGHVWTDGDPQTLSAHQVSARNASTTKGGQLGK